jgi:hypothetical protein
MSEPALIKEFMELFPEFNDLARDEYSCWYSGKHTGPFFTCVLDPVLLKELSSMQNPLLLERIFTYLEDLELSQDKTKKEIVLSTLVNLCSDKDLFLKARPLMGEKTSRVSRYVERFWGA